MTDSPPSTLMLWPMLAMAALTAAAWVAMGRRRFAAVRAGEVRMDAFRGDRAPDLPAAAAVATRHFANHFEIPVLFHVACLLHIAFSTGGVVAAALAWGFVALRALHTREHLGRNHVPTRFRIYAASTLLAWALWLAVPATLLLR